MLAQENQARLLATAFTVSLFYRPTVQSAEIDLLQTRLHAAGRQRLQYITHPPLPPKNSLSRPYFGIL